jgi:hypothetical protein
MIFCNKAIYLRRFEEIYHFHIQSYILDFEAEGTVLLGHQYMD